MRGRIAAYETYETFARVRILPTTQKIPFLPPAAVEGGRKAKKVSLGSTLDLKIFSRSDAADYAVNAL